MLKTFFNFKLDLLMESLIQESKIHFSDKFMLFLSSMKNNKIAKELLSISRTKVEADFPQNYIDTGKVKDEVTFVTGSKAREYLGKEIEIKYKVTNTNRYLTHSERNKNIFDRLGYTHYQMKNINGYDSMTYKREMEWDPQVGTLGVIKSESKSDTSDRIYVLFVGKGNGDERDGKETVLNKTAIINNDERSIKIWSVYRNSIKIGRLARSIMKVANKPFEDKEIEEFVNLYKATYDVMTDSFSKFKLVTGDEISKWYNVKNYESEDSTLGCSCMADKDSDFFDIYCSNKNCSMLILFSDKNGNIKNDRYESTKIKGRALVWTTTEGDIVMDRIYTNNDSDVSLFVKYAHEKGWWTKSRQNSDVDFTATNGNTSKCIKYKIQLEETRFDNYPYFDTFIYINFDDKVISNSMGDINAEGEMNDTGGEIEIF